MVDAGPMKIVNDQDLGNDFPTHLILRMAAYPSVCFVIVKTHTLKFEHADFQDSGGRSYTELPNHDEKCAPGAGQFINFGPCVYFES